jgi:Fe-S cluster assembly protein SufD
MPKKTIKIEPFVEQFAALASERRGHEPAWLRTLRQDALDVFQATGLPDRKTEAWKYTNLNKLSKVGFAPALPLREVDSLPVPLLPVDGYRIVFLNGHFQPALSLLQSLPEGVIIESLGATIMREPDPLEAQMSRRTPSRDMPLSALNMAFSEDGLFLSVAPGTKLERPIHVVSIGQATAGPVAFHMRSLLEVGAGASVDLLESHVGCGADTYFSNSVYEIFVDTDARLGHYRLQDESRNAFNIGLTNLEMARDARYDGFGLQIGATLARNEVRARIGGEGIECRINGAYLASGTQHIDNTTFVDHAEGGSKSRQVFKGVLDDQARGVFQGKVLVEPNAQKTDGHQLNRTLLLSRSAEMDCKPELEIYADDVKCSHGATVGELDEGALFYLRTRGIDPTDARDILIEAFIADVTEEIGHQAIREAFDGVVHQWLSDGQEALQ